ncbi:MAG: chromate transporter [Porphyromonas sp.]|nr:chromate transporter [Porphyromonas sp.]
MIYLQLFLVYFKIGLLGFGGGYAMLSLIQEEVVTNHQWLTVQEFTDIVAISQMTPGPIGVNSATYIGYTVTGSVWGALLATFSVMLPSFILVTLISISFAKIKDNPHIEAVFKGIRPATVGLIGAAFLMLLNRQNFIDPISVVLFLIAIVLVVKRWLHPILVIILGGIAGYLIYI